MQAYSLMVSPFGAFDYIESFGAVWHFLARHPRAGRARDEISEGLRSWRHGSHIVYYRVADDRVIVSRVLHAAAKPENAAD